MRWRAIPDPRDTCFLQRLAAAEMLLPKVAGRKHRVRRASEVAVFGKGRRRQRGGEVAALTQQGF